MGSFAQDQDIVAGRFIIKVARKKTHNGFSLIELITALGVAMVVLLISSTMLYQLYQEKKLADFRLALSEIRVSFQNAVLSSSAWKQSEASDSTMSCFSGVAASSCLALSGMTPRDFKIYSGDQVLFDSTSATAGYTPTGQPCDAYGVGGCILKPRVTWQAQCNLTADPICNAPLILVSLSFQVSGTEFSFINFGSYGFQISKATFGIQSKNSCAGGIPTCAASQAAVCENAVWVCEEFGL